MNDLALMMTIITAATAGVILQEGYASIIQMEVALIHIIWWVLRAFIYW